MKRCLFIISYSLLLSLCLRAEIPNYWLGELPDSDMAPVYRYDYLYDHQTGDFQSLEQNDDFHYIEQFFSQDFVSTDLLANESFLAKTLCPNKDLIKSSSYIRYLFRLLAMSYYMEFYVNLHYMGIDLGQGNFNSCPLEWDSLFSKCQPKTDDMKLFLKRGKVFFNSEIAAFIYKRKSENEVNEFILKTVNSWETSNELFHTALRSLPQVIQGKVEKETFSGLHGKICEKIRLDMANLCSEVDEFYGYYQLPLARSLVADSSAINAINQNGNAKYCLERYSLVMRFRERSGNFLSKIFSGIYQEIQKKNRPYHQGKLFVPGSLKEFDDKGLKDFIFVAQTPKKDRPKPMPTVAPVMIPTPKVEVALIQTPTPTPRPLLTPTPLPERKSQFEMSVEEFYKNDGKKMISVDMKLMDQDFLFSKAMIDKLKGPLQVFKSIKAIEDMKRLDQIGLRQRPLSLMFIKYLLDTADHQGLYNIIHVLGSKFYINNDIEMKEDPVYIHLHNDASTSNRWQIDIIPKDKI